MKRGRPYAWDVAKRAEKRRALNGRRNRPAAPAGYVRKVGYYGRYTKNANLKRMQMGLSPEKKFFDTALAFTFDTTGEVPATGQLALIPQGDTESTRDGRKAVIKSIQIRGTLTISPTASTVTDCVCYLYLVLDTQCNGAAAAITDVFTSNSMSDNQLQLNNSGRFRILKRWVKVFNPTAGGAPLTTAFGSQTKVIEYFKRCNIDMDWNSTLGAITEIRSNNIFLMAGSAPAGAGRDDVVTVVGSCRLRFVG